jgi:hypothetical protein
VTTTTVPPRYLPTLTDVVVRTQLASTTSDQGTATAGYAELDETQWTQRIMQRVDVILERRLREALSKVILEHTQALAPLLRHEIEVTVTQAVAQALAHEIAQSQSRHSS